jgi:hypothetical protein
MLVGKKKIGENTELSVKGAKKFLNADKNFFSAGKSGNTKGLSLLYHPALPTVLVVAPGTI